MNSVDGGAGMDIPLPRLRDDLDLPVVGDLRELFLRQRPMIDTRAPVEFAQGSFPTATNLPLLSNDERERIGTCYKHEGHDAAVRLGARLVDGDKKRSRVAHWADFLREHPDGVLFCFRGGMRSRVAQQWLYEETGIVCPRVEGGYKSLRRFLLEVIEQRSSAMRPIVLGGRTGSGKTVLLRKLANAIDLEGLANHRGSAFGPTATPQPGQIDFENRLAIDLLMRQAAGHATLVFEDEGPNIGVVSTPRSLYQRLQQAPLVVMHVADEERERNALKDYIVDTHADFARLHGEERGFELFAAYLLASIDKIRKRLGGERHQRLRAAMESAIARHRAGG
ncbi:MAG TPA: tRNA 2-selenouridine(34) synthase MnmH, partial [Chromatiaceae bacterium]|nr:tRNA 2-selenouridine(34) synthase MnmH [Chromatiaceae bacterium]